jgi:predicted Zn-dependent protease with MMP-like domain
MWAKQKAVIRGQGYNLVESLRRGAGEGGSPVGLLRRPVVAVFDEEDEVENGIERIIRKVGHRFEIFRVQPWFTWC